MRAALAAVPLSTTLATSAAADTIPPVSNYFGNVFTPGDSGSIGKVSADMVDPSDESQGWNISFGMVLDGFGSGLLADLRGISIATRLVDSDLRVTAQVTGNILNGFMSEQSFGGLIDLALDGTWSCSGDCLVPIYDYGQEMWLAGTTALTNGTYTLSPLREKRHWPPCRFRLPRHFWASLSRGSPRCAAARPPDSWAGGLRPPVPLPRRRAPGTCP